MDVELAVAHTIGILRQYDRKRSGKLEKGTGNNAKMIEYSGRKKCTFQEFVDESNETNNLDEWFARYILRYSCSSACCLFERFIIPELITKGIDELDTKFGTIQLKNLETHDLFIKTINPMHKIFFTKAVEAIEEDCGRGFYGHNVLVCKESGCVIDFSIGQFTGKINEQYIYPDIESICNMFSTPVSHGKCSSSLIEVQNNRDQMLSDWHKTPPPLKLSRIAVQRMLNGWSSICRGCYGTSLKLKKCSKCKTVMFCGVKCQKRKWAEHRPTCLLKKCGI